MVRNQALKRSHALIETTKTGGASDKVQGQTLSDIIFEEMSQNGHDSLSIAFGGLLCINRVPLTGLNSILLEWIPMVAQYVVARLVFNKMTMRDTERTVIDLADICEVIASVQST